MRLIAVDDLDDPRLEQFWLNERGLASRAEKRDDNGGGLFLAEGDLVVERAHAAGCRPVAALADAERVPPIAYELGIDVFVGSDEVRRRVRQRGAVQPIVALFERPARPSVQQPARDAERLVIAEAVDNPINVGALVRNAAALGWDGLVLDHTSADPLARRSLRVAMGTVFTLPHARTRHMLDALDELRQTGFHLVALTPAAPGLPLDEIAHQIFIADARQSGPDSAIKTGVGDEGAGCVGDGSAGRALSPMRIGLVVGAEREGLSEDVLERADIRARIPMHSGVDSLNAAAATAIACYALRPR